MQEGVHCPSAARDRGGRYLSNFNYSKKRSQPEWEWFSCMTVPWFFTLEKDGFLRKTRRRS